jgi:hypothetical protein
VIKMTLLLMMILSTMYINAVKLVVSKSTLTIIKSENVTMLSKNSGAAVVVSTSDHKAVHT